MKVRISLQKDPGSIPCDKHAVEKLLQEAFALVAEAKKIRTKNVKDNLPALRKAKQLSVDIILTGDKQVRALNKQYRKLDKTTDVLSFSTLDAGLVPHRDLHLGDIVISSPMVRSQAVRFKLTEARELQRVIVHGFLHLLGFDHVHVHAPIRNEMRSFEDATLGVKSGPSDITAALEQKLLSIKSSYATGTRETYVGGGKSSLRYLGLTMPQVRSLLAEVVGEYPALDGKALAKIFTKTDIHELKTLALLYIEKQQHTFSHKNLFTLLSPLVKHMDNWALSDTLSSFYAYCLEHAPAAVLPTLQKWNKHKQEWFIRQSMVSLLYYSSQRKKVLPFKTCIAFVKPHLRSEYPYVQKAVGWTLRELRNVYPKETEKFLERHIKDIKGYALSAATEKMDKRQKAYFKSLKKRDS